MMFISDTDLYKARRVITGRIYKENKGWKHLFCDHDDFLQWVLSATNEGIAVALNDSDNFDSTKGDLIHWCYLKARKVADRDIRQERRQKRAAEVVMEATPEEYGDPFANFLLADQLVDILEEITEEQKKALSLVYLLGLNHDQAAQILKRQRNAVDALIFRAKKKAREVYRRNMKAEDSRAKSQQSPPSPPTFRQPRNSLNSDPDEPDGVWRKSLGEATDG